MSRFGNACSRTCRFGVSRRTVEGLVTEILQTTPVLGSELLVWPDLAALVLARLQKVVLKELRGSKDWAVPKVPFASHC
jgi:hypothetical protein